MCSLSASASTSAWSNGIAHASIPQQVARARYAAELARRRYTAVDPDNRLVAAELERP